MTVSDANVAMARRPVQPLAEAAEGFIWCSYPYADGMVATVALGVRDGRIVDCPPMAWSWAMGGDARGVWDRAVERGETLRERYGEETVIRWVPAR